MLIDEYMPRFDVTQRHRVRVAADSQAAYRSLRSVDLARSRPVRLLLAIRGFPGLLLRGKRGPVSFTLDDFVRSGFVLLEEKPGDEIVLGLVGKFWKPTGSLRREIDRSRFRSFAEPGYAKAAWNFTVGPLGTGAAVVSTETRVQVTDRGSRRKFLRYWRVVGPFSGFIRRRALELVKADAEAASRRTT